jgi:transcriptional regulator with XRE-family HTH domain
MTGDIYTEPTDVSIMPTRQDTPVDSDNAEAIVQSVVEATNDSKKVKFLGFRASGFTIRESLSLVGIHEKTLSRWREGDILFQAHEANLPELRKTLGTEFAHLEFMRNYRLILEKDFRVISKSLSKNTDNELTPAENSYLLKARAHYTPQQLQVMQQLIGAGKDNTVAFDFTQFVLTMSRKTTTDEVKLEGKA